MSEKDTVWEPETQLDRELVQALKQRFKDVPREIRRERAWVITRHARERYAHRLQRVTFAEDTNDVGLSLAQDLDHPRLKQATEPDMAVIRASCQNHAGQYSREPYRYFLLRDTKRQLDEVFVVVRVTWSDLAYALDARETWRVVTCFFMKHEDGAARRTRTQDALFKGLRTGAVQR